MHLIMQDMNILLAFLYCVCKLCFIILHFIIYKYAWLWDFFNNANKIFASFGIMICIIYLCFCKFVVRIRHLSIKIIYTSRTGQMIVLYNNIISNNPDQNQIVCHAFCLYIPGIYSNILCFSICIFGQCVINPLWRFIPQQGGILHFDLIRLLPVPGYAFHSYLPPKIHPTEVPSPTISKLCKIPTQFNKPLRQSLRHTIKISLNQYQ